MSDNTENKPGSYRQNRVADLIREEIANYLIRGAKDPRIGFVTITRVEMTADLDIAHVFFTTYGERREQVETTNGLLESAREIRGHLGRVLTLKHTPKVEFHQDKGLENSFRIGQLLGQIEAERLERDDEGDDPLTKDLKTQGAAKTPAATAKSKDKK
jgi:ribosome-binding factor A